MLNESHTANNKRIAKNTLILYGRMILLMCVSLYTSRVVLNALGVEDFGIYNVVGSIVSMFSILSNTLTSAISRFLTFELGRNDISKLNRVFCTSIIIQIILAIIIILVIEPVGTWFVYNKLQIPQNRLNATIWVMHLSVLTFAINLISVPYNALIIAHEKMSAFAYISIFEAIMKLGIALLLTFILFDKLIVYTILMATVAIILRFIYGIYSKRNFEEAKFRFIFDKKLLKDMLSFSGWNFIGVSTVILRDQGGNIVLNMFCGPVVNAARGVSMQINSAVDRFVSSFQTAFKPQIMKSYASGDRHYMMSLIFRGAKFSFYLLLLLSLPIIIETQYILELWLKTVPDHAANFSRLILFFYMSESLMYPIITGLHASGKIRNFQLVVGAIQILNLPLSYFALKFGFPPESVLIIALIISQICIFVKLIMVKPLIGIDVNKFIKEVYFNVLCVLTVSIILPLAINQLMPESFIRFVCCSILSLFSASMAIWFIGLAGNERSMIITKVRGLKIIKSKK